MAAASAASRTTRTSPFSRKTIEALRSEAIRKSIQRLGSKVEAGKEVGLSPATMTRLKDTGDEPAKPVTPSPKTKPSREDTPDDDGATGE